VHRAEGCDQHHGASAALDEPAAEGMGQFEVGDGVEVEPLVEVEQVLVEEPAGMSVAGVGHEQTYVQVLGRGDEIRCAAGAAEVDGDDAVFDLVGERERSAQVLQPVGGARGQYEVQPVGGALFGKGSADTG
jgi:hypothetical protein